MKFEYFDQHLKKGAQSLKNAIETDLLWKCYKTRNTISEWELHTWEWIKLGEHYFLCCAHDTTSHEAADCSCWNKRKPKSFKGNERQICV